MVHERSYGNLALVLVAAVLLGVSLALPWFHYEHSTGRRTPPEGFHDTTDTGVLRESWSAQPGASEGTQASEDPAATERATDWMAWSVYGAMGLLLLAALSEVPGIDRLLVRRATLGLSTLAFLLIVAAVAIAWFVLPGTYGHGVDGAYTSARDDTGYTLTEVGSGWIVALVATIPVFAGFLLKFQAGAPDPTIVAELYAKGEL